MTKEREGIGRIGRETKRKELTAGDFENKLSFKGTTSFGAKSFFQQLLIQRFHLFIPNFIQFKKYWDKKLEDPIIPGQESRSGKLFRDEILCKYG